ncbi:LDCC motif putative metal-binding protein [Clostridium sp.]
MKKLKKWYDNFIKRMEKANEESFGDKKLDCCGLNDNKNNNPIKNKK